MRRTITLSKETLRVLDDEDLIRVVGGGGDSDHDDDHDRDHHRHHDDDDDDDDHKKHHHRHPSNSWCDDGVGSECRKIWSRRPPDELIGHWIGAMRWRVSPEWNCAAQKPGSRAVRGTF